MAKALKAFRVEGDTLKPLYAAGNKSHPNYTSQLGHKQTFVPDKHDLNRVGFSTLGLRTPASKMLFKQLLKVALNTGGKFYTVDVEDEQDTPLRTRDTNSEAERVFKTITPIEELNIPDEVLSLPNVDSPYKLSNMDRALRKKYSDNMYSTDSGNTENWSGSPYSNLEDQLAQSKEQYKRWVERAKISSGEDATFAWSNADRLYSDIKSIERILKEAKQDMRVGYKDLRKLGYTPKDVQDVINAYKTDAFSAYEELYDLFSTSPGAVHALDKYIKALEEDPDYVSDLRSKNIINAVGYRAQPTIIRKDCYN